MKVVFFSLFSSFADKGPSGAGKSNLYHMKHLAGKGHSGLFMCPLVPASRNEALSTLQRNGVHVTSEEYPLFFIDQFVYERVHVLTYTFKSVRDMSWMKRVMFAWEWVRSQFRTGSGVRRHSKTFFEMLNAIIQYGFKLKPRFEMWLNWLRWRLLEPYVQAISPILGKKIREFHPAYLFVDGFVPFMELALELSSYVENGNCKVIPRVSTSLQLNYGPMAGLSAETDVLTVARGKGIYRKMDGFVTPSHYLNEYLKKWSDLELDSHVVYAPMDDLNNRDEEVDRHPERGFVMLINGCNEKGLPIFLELARRLPQVPFATIITWGKLRGQQEKQLKKLPNVQLLKPMFPVDPIYDMTRILLVPSLWDETFPRVVFEAMLRGIPVLASDVGGLPEAKLGIDYVLPVNPYTSARDYAYEPPVQDIEPWVKALEELLSSPEHYQKISRTSQKAARAFVLSNETTTLIQPFEREGEK